MVTVPSQPPTKIQSTISKCKHDIFKQEERHLVCCSELIDNQVLHKFMLTKENGEPVPNVRMYINKKKIDDVGKYYNTLHRVPFFL